MFWVELAPRGLGCGFSKIVFFSVTIAPGAHKRKERVTSILYRCNQEVKSSASGCGVMRLNDYHIRLVCCSAVVMTRNPYELWVPGLGLLILNAPYLVIDTTCFPHMHIRSSIVWGQLRTYQAKSHTPFSYGLLIVPINRVGGWGVGRQVKRAIG